MKEDLVAALREEVREDRERVSVLERVASGAATADEIARLEAEATSDERLARELEAAKPLGPDTEARIAARLLAGKTKTTTDEPRERAHAEKPSAPPVLAPKKKEAATNVVSFRQRLVRIGGPLAVAAVLILYFSTRPPAAADLPMYAVAANGEQAMRSAPNETTKLVVGGSKTARFELVARPAHAVDPDARVVAYAFAVRGSDVASLDDVKIEVSRDGAVRATGASRELEGASAVRLVIGVAGAITKFDEALERARRSTSDKHALVLTIPVEHR